MTLHEISGVRDLTFNNWHRVALPRYCSMIDIDGLEWCNVYGCYEPLLLVETSRNPNKSTTVLRKLAERANLPAVLIVWEASADVCRCSPYQIDVACSHGLFSIQVKWIRPPGVAEFRTAASLAEGIKAVHDKHRAEVHSE